MNIPRLSQANQTKSDGGYFSVNWIRAHLAQCIESLWCCLAFLLFLLLGPFSAVVVLIGLGSLANEENRKRMTEPARL
jgi:hypothetical protein